MDSTMQDVPLLISSIARHGEWLYANKKVFTITANGTEEATFAQISRRAEQLAKALARLGISSGDRVATFQWNNQAHMEAYLAVPSMGAVLHTLNIRLFPEQLAFIINHADDRVIIVDGSLIPLLAAVRDQIPGVKYFIVKGEGDRSLLGDTLDYDELRERRRAGLRLAHLRRAQRRGNVLHPRAPPATPREWSTRTARCGCTRWPQ
jgi:fatty-acyl-CoA synthase